MRILRFYRIVKFTKKRISQIPFSVFRILLSVTPGKGVKKSNSPKSEFIKSRFSVFRIPLSVFRKGVAGAVAPVRPSRRRFLLRFIEKENGGGTTKKSVSFLPIGKRSAENGKRKLSKFAFL